MAIQAINLYTRAWKNISIPGFLTDTFVCTLHTSSYTPAADTHELWSDVSATELATANGYTAGGVELKTKALNQVSAEIRAACANIRWATFSATCRYAVVTQRAGASLVAGDKLFGFWDLTGGGDFTGGGLEFRIDIATLGYFAKFTHSP